MQNYLKLKEQEEPKGDYMKRNIESISHFLSEKDERMS